jgi:hypothetical protein
MVSIFNCLNALVRSDKFNYEALQKKDDDYFIVSAEKWISNCRIPNGRFDDELKGIDKINKFAQKILASLQDVYICSANVKLIQGHLAKIAQQNGSLHNLIFERLNNGQVKGDKKMIDQIVETLIFL